jgi:hypothetical protein
VHGLKCNGQKTEYSENLKNGVLFPSHFLLAFKTLYYKQTVFNQQTIITEGTFVQFSTNIVPVINIMPVTVAERSRACTVFTRSEAWIVGSNSTQGMDV